MDNSGAATPSIAYRVFTFEESKENTTESLSLSIPEVLDAQYGMYVWPCAVVLAQYLWTRREELRDKTVLELGAGVSLPGVVAARCGAKVILSDSDKTPSCLENCRRSCEANGVRDVVVLGLTWGEVSPDLVLLPELDIILGSDVFYDPEVLIGRSKLCSTGGGSTVRTFSWKHLMLINLSWLDRVCQAGTASS